MASELTEGGVHIPLAQDTSEKDDSTAPRGSDILSDAARYGRALGVASRPAGYCMIESLEIENFRAFKKLSLARLKPLNIIVGTTGAAKRPFLRPSF
jgi:hypothetical protein